MSEQPAKQRQSQPKRQSLEVDAFRGLDKVEPGHLAGNSPSSNAKSSGNDFLKSPKNQQVLTSFIKKCQMEQIEKNLEGQFGKQLEKYMFEIGKYSFIGDTLDQIKLFTIEQQRKLIV